MWGGGWGVGEGCVQYHLGFRGTQVSLTQNCKLLTQLLKILDIRRGGGI